MGIRILVVEDEEKIADFLVRGLREEGFTVEHAADGVRVNAIAPGFVITEINEDYLKGRPDMTRNIPVGRLGETRDLDGALLLLASEAGAFMSGSVVTVDGGHLLAMA